MLLKPFILFIRSADFAVRKTLPLRLFCLASVFFFFTGLVIVADYRDLSLIKTADSYQIPSVLYGQNAKGEFEPIAEYYKFSKQVQRLSDLSAEGNVGGKKVIRSFLSAEDNEFYSHFGLDFRGIARAMMVNIAAGKVKEGASTITQQVARLKFLSVSRTFLRKAREAWLALIMERFYPKDKILEMYLNEIPLGHGTFGVGAASKFYFRKDISALEWGEAAMLASLTTRPREFSPLVNPNLSSSKVRVNFMKLVENGILTVQDAEKEYDKFSEYYSTLNRSPNDSAYSDRLNRFPYFTEWTRRQLLKKFNENQIYSGGLKIYSTLVITHQEAAESVLYEGLANQTKVSNQRAFKEIDLFDEVYGSTYEMLLNIHDLSDFRFKITKEERTFISAYQEEYRDIYNVLNLLGGSEEVAEVFEENYIRQGTRDHLLPVEGSIISMRPDTGYVTAVVGGSGFRSDNQQIRSFQSFRQPGSSFKPLVYAVTLDYFGKNPTKGKNITAATQFLDSPLNFLLDDGEEWNPENYGQEYSGFVRLRTALETSRNSVAVRVVDEVGLGHIIDPLTELLQPSGRTIPKNYSVALGTFEVTPFELTKAYAVFANAGKEVMPSSILYVTDQSDNVLNDYREELKKKTPKQILSPEASYVITSMMEDVIKKGTGKAVKNYGLKSQVAGKTGTTNNFRDAWFVGFTPDLVASVWLGYDLGTLTLGKGMAGGVIATPIWGKFVSTALKNEKVRSKFDFGNNLKIERQKVCALSGKLPGSSCRKTFEEVFIKDTVPDEVCNDHGGIFGPPDVLEPPDLGEPDSKKKKKKKSKNKNMFQGDEKID